ncbi:MAG: hypothetical protein ACOYOK_00170 [Pseudobdellovibrionaceae bacterium]
MALRSEPTSQNLEKKLLIMGFEVPDVLAIFLLLSILNFSFGQTNYKLALVWGPVAAFAIVLRIGKRGKPENYLVHLGKFYAQPKYLSAFQDSTNTAVPPKLKGNF